MAKSSAQRTFLSIGTGPGIGLETARRFAREGYRLVLASRSPSKLDTQVAALRGQGVDVNTVALDAGDGEAVTRLVQGHAERLGVLHYNAAHLSFGPTIGEIAPDNIDGDIQIGLTSAVRAVQAALPALASQGGGTILLTGGGLADTPHPQALTLSIAKAGLRSLAMALAPSLKTEGINIASLMINASITPESDEARAVADAFWAIHAAAQDQWRPDVPYPA